MSIANIFVPVFISTVIIFGIVKKIDIFSCFREGAKEGFQSGISLIPTLIGLLISIGMFKASGALDVLCYALGDLFAFLGVPSELIPLALLKPLSGSGASVVLNDVLKAHGPDSFIGKAASVMQGSTETTFYAIAVYFGATAVRKTRYTLPAALVGDVVGVIVSCLAVRLFMP